MMNFKNEEAVSPVIGVILMVAITVILAAVIAAFVFGMTGNVQTTKTVAATATHTGDKIIVTYQGGADADLVSNLTVMVNEQAISNVLNNTTGSSISVNGTYVNEGRVNHVVVTAKFTDGTSQVILDTTV